MEIKELMIGNLVNTQFGVKQVDSITRQGNGVYKLTLCTEKDGIRTCENIFSSEVNPIKLTDDWLRKFGFDDNDYKDGYIGKEFKTNLILDFVLTKPHKLYETQEHYVFEMREHRILQIKYVHQLQNVFFEITTKELVLKELGEKVL